ncbi:MAG: hypothetical protein ACREOU_17000 [Candidatus Eiseniibacteriota bacterium]
MKTPVSWASRRILVPAALVAAAGVVVWGCSKNPVSTDTDLTSGQTTLETAARIELPADNAAVQTVMAVQNRHTDEIMRIPGVVGVGTSADETGTAVIRVFTEKKLPPGLLKQEFEGVRVVEEVSGRIMAFKGPGGGGGGGHTALQTPPIQLGTSGGPALDLANGFCCGGTLGSLVHIGSTQYILSNSHVFAGDVTSGGNGRVSTIGDDITQPGLIDVNCNAAGANVVADLSSLSTLFPPNSTPNVDASIAQVRAGQVRTDGSILAIGTISSSTVAASIGQNVKKSGRTTGLTRSSVSTLNVTVNVGYSNECAGGSFTKTFTGQIIVSQKRSNFLNSGDSGSLMVEDVSTNPRAVGLLYAGSASSAVANPINAVLSHFGASMVGN